MSKRKSQTNTLVVDKSDMVFEDDSSDPDIDQISSKATSSLNSERNSTVAKSSGSRVSARGKREKKIYDPSDSGPVHKKKKEAFDAKKSPMKPKTPVKTPSKVVEELPVKAKIATPQSAKRRLSMSLSKDNSTKQPEKLTKPQVVPSVSKDQKQILAKSTENPPVVLRATLVPLKGILRSTSPAPPEKATPLPRLSVVPNASNIRNWKASDVAAYFVREGFEFKDAANFVEQEIDGETLMLMQREDMKNLNLRVGVFIKMWNRVSKLQSGKSDPTQGWK